MLHNHTMFYDGKQICLTRYNEDCAMVKEIVAFKTETNWATCWRVFEIDACGNKTDWDFMEGTIQTIWHILYHLLRGN